jgi:hypothetical protein
MELKEKIPVRSDKAASRIIEGEAVIVVLDQQQTIVLNEVGSRIWEIIDGEKNIDSIVQAITSEFDSTYGVALEDISVFLEDLAQRGAVLFA